MSLGSALLGMLAGMLSTLSPCVLPLLPLVVGGAVSAHRAGAWLLAAGLALSFTAIGLFVATVGFTIGLDGSVFRTVSAIMLGGFGLVLLSSGLQSRFASAAGPVGDGGNRLIERWAPRAGTGSGQFLTGLLLGAVWAPCAGPTLGAASLLAARMTDLGAVALVMFAFGIGAALPLLLVGLVSRTALLRWRGRLRQAGSSGKYLFGGVAVLTAVMILSGADHAVEGWAVDASPEWLTALTTRF